MLPRFAAWEENYGREPQGHRGTEKEEEDDERNE